MEKATEVVTGEVRMSFVHVFKPYAYTQGSEEKYSVTILLPKTDVDTKARIDAAIEAAKQMGKEKWNGVIPPVCPDPVHDGDGVKPSDGLPFGQECKGCWVFTASSKADYPPEVVDAKGNPIISQSEMYSGVYGRASINFYAYNANGNKGIACGLNNLQKIRDGEPLGGKAKAEDDFATEDDDDFLS